VAEERDEGEYEIRRLDARERDGRGRELAWMGFGAGSRTDSGVREKG
jgi:hypothetical protein